MIKFDLCPPDSLWVYPIAKLGAGFGLYLELIKAAGGKFSDAGGQKRHKLAIAAFDGFVTSLEENGFQPKLSMEVMIAVRAYDAQKKAHVQAAGDRSEVIDQELRARGLQLYDYQKVGIKRLAGEPSLLLADQQGLGKTIQALIAAPAGFPMLVVCPSIAKGVWEAEAAKWRPDFKVTVLEGRTIQTFAKVDGRKVVVDTKPSFHWPAADELCIVNYDVLPPTPVELENASTAVAEAKTLLTKWEEAYQRRKAQPQPISEDEKLQRETALSTIKDTVAKAQKKLLDLQNQSGFGLPLSGTTLVADELHSCKGKSSRTARLMVLAKIVRANRGRTWGATGTPLLNKPPELYKMLSCLDLATKAFGSWPTFVELFGGVKGQWGGTEWGRPDPSVPERMRKVSLRRTRIEVLPQLPVKTWRTHKVAIDKATQKLCDDATGELAKVGVRLDDAKDLAKITAVKGAGFELLSKARLALAAVKLPAAIELVEELEEQEEPVLVFASHRGPIEVLGKREGWACITGSTSDVERKRLNDAFQAGQLKGLALTIQAGGTALTLTRAAQVIFIDRAWTPALNEQAEDRVCRIGATRGIVITIMEANHAIDYRVNELLLQKSELVAGTLGGAT